MHQNVIILSADGSIIIDNRQGSLLLGFKIADNKQSEPVRQPRLSYIQPPSDSIVYITALQIYIQHQQRF